MPPEDEELPLTAHIEEMVRRLLVVLFVISVGMLVVFYFSTEMIKTIWYNFLPNTEIRVYKPFGLILTRLKFSGMAGVAAAIPVLVYETFAFMKPGLYPNERRYYIAVVPVSVVLVGLGLVFSYFVALPVVFDYFLRYSEPVADSGLGLSETFSLILLLSLGLGVVFQIPLLIFLAVKMNVTSRDWLASKRIVVWLSFLSIAFVFAPDPTGMAAVVVAGTMVALFEITLFLLRFTSGSDSEKTSEASGA
ncbi:MAG: twin-arginine translocase subunit TatC [Halobacteria archaeon]|nr:twin-arginine translocase subunit TatC [Halobacteria archaeon]